MTNDFKAIPDTETIVKAADLHVLDEHGNEVRFGDLIKHQKTVVVFIRHFFCGAFVERLASVPAASLAQADTQIIVVGCGDWNPISVYKELTTFNGPIYADPSRSLYRTLGMNIENLETTPKGLAKKSYLTLGPLSNALRSIWRATKNPTLIGKQGNLSQLGGDFIFAPGITCTFASRMQHTEDHTEVVDLMEEAGVAYPST